MRVNLAQRYVQFRRIETATSVNWRKFSARLTTCWWYSMRTQSIDLYNARHLTVISETRGLSFQGRLSIFSENLRDFSLVLIKVGRRVTTKIILHLISFYHTTILPQVLSDMPYTDRWTCCPSSYDRLMWLVQRNPRVIVNNIWLQVLPLPWSVMFISLFPTTRTVQKREKAREWS